MTTSAQDTIRDTVRQAAVIGGGIMGGDIAVLLAAGGWRVHVMSPSEKTRAALPARVAAGLARLGSAPDRAHSVEVHAGLGDLPWTRVELVVEAVTEDLSLKQRLFADLGRLARPDAVLATNTSTFAITSVGRDAAYPERVVGLHFFMPAHLVPLVEVVHADFTDSAFADRLFDWMVELGKQPIRVAKDVPGFVGNRIQHAMMREALWLIETGVTDAAGVDAAVRYGFGFRFIACGPMLQKEMSGWDTNFFAARALYPHLHTEPAPPPFLKRMVEEGRTGMKAGRGLWEWTPEAIAAEKAAIEWRLQAGMAILADEKD
jgi:3-hydroxybutyryl-CoA dehydrogenase